MLTLTETIDAIRALNTEADIILGACKRIANPDKYSADADNAAFPSTIAAQILREYQDKVLPSEFADQLLRTLATHIAIYCVAGKEVEVIKGSAELLTRYFLAARKEAMRLRLMENPTEAIADFIKTLKSMPEPD